MICTACHLPPAERASLDAALRSGEAVTAIARRFSLSRASTIRHKENHLPASNATVLPPEQADPADEVLAQLKSLQGYTRLVLARSLQEEGAADDTALKAIRELSRLLTQQTLLVSKLQRARFVEDLDLRLNDAFVSLTRAAGRALGPFPEARQALSAELSRIKPKKKHVERGVRERGVARELREKSGQ